MAAVRTFSLFSLIVVINKQLELGAAKFDTEIEHKHTHTFYVQH